MDCLGQLTRHPANGPLAGRVTALEIQGADASLPDSWELNGAHA